MSEFETHTWKTFRDWSNSGYQILKGSKGTKVNGEWMFNETQVMKSTYQPSGGDPSEEGNGEWDDEDSWFDPMDWGDN